MLENWVWPFFPNVAIFWLVTGLVVAWSMAWKGVALWRASGNGHLVWFVVLLLINTLGILEIIYIFVFSRERR